MYAPNYGPRREKHPRWVPAIVKKALGTRCFNVKVVLNGPVWRQHWEQLQPRYAAEENNKPGEVTNVSEFMTEHPMEEQDMPQTQRKTEQFQPKSKVPAPEYGPDDPR